MDVNLPLTLFWRGLRLSPQQIYELIALSPGSQDFYLKSLGFDVPAGWRELGQRELEWCYREKVSVIPFWHPDYPTHFFKMDRVPLILTAKGGSNFNRSDSISVVGSRNLSWSAANWLESEFYRFLTRAPRLVVSGGARGADQLAHRIAIRSLNPTVCLLPSGLGKVYPETLRLIEGELMSVGGGYLSPYGPFQEMRKSHFSYRNEMIALLSPLVLVVEARERSGSLLTASQCLRYGNELAILPSAPSAGTMGGLKMLRDGAIMVLEAQDIDAIYDRLNLRHFHPLSYTEAKPNKVGQPCRD